MAREKHIPQLNKEEVIEKLAPEDKDELAQNIADLNLLVENEIPEKYKKYKENITRYTKEAHILLKAGDHKDAQKQLALAELEAMKTGYRKATRDFGYKGKISPEAQKKKFNVEKVTQEEDTKAAVKSVEGKNEAEIKLARKAAALAEAEAVKDGTNSGDESQDESENFELGKEVPLFRRSQTKENSTEEAQPEQKNRSLWRRLFGKKKKMVPIQEVTNGSEKQPASTSPKAVPAVNPEAKKPEKNKWFSSRKKETSTKKMMQSKNRKNRFPADLKIKK